MRSVLAAAVLLVGAAACRTTGTDLTLLQKADGVYLYHHARYECSCRQTPEAGIACEGALVVKDCAALHKANAALATGIAQAEYVRHGSLGPAFDGQVALPKEQRARIADLMDVCKATQ